ncbi:methanol oxidation system protein MoxJ [Thiohalorhabdus methylotrophus]|uniref:Methanol oxidation system protein MoxJ n=1 Tax=Thiohalorhabdus methylotrophus TaxID=3242694 RepID=A0ABV4TXY9_9GAMM
MGKETLRVCAAKDELPYSSAEKNGFENEIAEIVADAMNRELKFVWADRPGIYLVPEFLRKDKCDVVMGLDSDDPRVATTQPYYRSSYVFVYPADAGVEVKDWESGDLADMTRFAVTPYSPVEAKLREMGKWRNNLNYMFSLIGYASRRNEYVRYDPQRMISEVASGKADIAIVWGPKAARYVKQASRELTMNVVPDTRTSDGPVVFHYAQSMGTRKEDKALRDALNQAIEARYDKIRSVLKDEGFPLLGVAGSATAKNHTGD